ncbi:MAG TPA: hypothetical protein VGE74_29825 [Gemmata sp.]
MSSTVTVVVTIWPPPKSSYTYAATVYTPGPTNVWPTVAPDEVPSKCVPS